MTEAILIWALAAAAVFCVLRVMALPAPWGRFAIIVWGVVFIIWLLRIAGVALP